MKIIDQIFDEMPNEFGLMDFISKLREQDAFTGFVETHEFISDNCIAVSRGQGQGFIWQKKKAAATQPSWTRCNELIKAFIDSGATPLEQIAYIKGINDLMNKNNQ